MPSALTYPGVYVEEIPSGVRTIVGVGTSIAAFVGRAARGPVNKAVVINSFGDFERRFGGIWGESTLGFAVRDFFLNGGSQAIIVRLFHATPGSNASEAQLVTEGEATAKVIIEAAKVRLAKQPVEAEDIAAAIATPVEEEKAKGGVAALVAQRLSEVARAAASAEAGKPSVDSVSLVTRSAVAKYDAANAATKAAVKAVGDAADEVAKGEEPTVNDILVACATACAALTGIPAAALEAANDVLQEVAVATQKGPDTIGPGEVVAALENASARDVKAAATKAAEQPSTVTLKWNDLVLKAASEGAWGNNLKFRVDTKINEDYAAEQKIPIGDLFNIEVLDTATGRGEYFRNLTIAGSRPVSKVLEYESELVRVSATGTATPTAHPESRVPKPWYDDSNYSTKVAADVGDGENLVESDIIASETHKQGIYALDDVDLFNLLCIPPLAAPGVDNADVPVSIWGAAAAYCQRRRALLVIDPPFNPDSAKKDKIRGYVEEDLRGSVSANARNAAFFYPSILATSPKTGQPEAFAPCGAVAGVFARTDTTRGVWKAPAGIEAGIVGTVGLSTPLTDAENGQLNPVGINCLRSLPSAGRIVWGSRTLAGDDRMASEWKYIPVRRTALYIEESLYRGTHWVVFEPNDEPLWGQIRLNVGAFMNDLYRKGAFQGQTPGAAYFVKCDKETNPQNDIDKGIVNIHVGFAPLKPAEFVVIKLQQIAGQILT